MRIVKCRLNLSKYFNSNTYKYNKFINIHRVYIIILNIYFTVLAKTLLLKCFKTLKEINLHVRDIRQLHKK